MPDAAFGHSQSIAADPEEVLCPFERGSASAPNARDLRLLAVEPHVGEPEVDLSLAGTV